MTAKLTRREFECLVGLTLVGSSASALGIKAEPGPAPSSSDGSYAEDKSSDGQRQPDLLKPWADAVARKWANVSKARLLMDMSLCHPASALTPQARTGHWQVVPYELVDGKQGKLLWAAMEQNAPEIRLPLGAKGWHAIFVGIYATVLGPSTLWLKLDGDVSAQPRTSEEYAPYGSFTEVFFKVAELNNDTLQIKQSAGAAVAAGLVYVKLIPLSEGEVSGFQADSDQRDTRRLATTNDGLGFLINHRPTTVEEVLREIEVFRNTDFGTLILHVGGADGCDYPSQYGHMLSDQMDGLVYPDPTYRQYGEAVRELARKGINPTKVLIEGAHSLGMKVHVGIRPAIWTYYEPLRRFFDSPFYQAHPGWRCVDRDGTSTTRMSWAVPEVRKHLIDVLREAVSFGADGAHLVFGRGVPVVLYEPSFLEIFQKRYGQDPRNLDEESDPRIKQAWAEVVTTFMREARAMLDEEQKRRGDGKHLGLSAMTFSNEYNNLLYGIDVRQWVAEGVIDEIYTDQYGIGGKKAGVDINFFLEVCRPKGIPFFPSYTVFSPPSYDNTISQALSWYEQGVQGVVFFDAGGERVTQGTTVSRLGHVEELRLRDPKESGAPKSVVQIPFHRLGDLVMDGRFPPTGGG